MQNSTAFYLTRYGCCLACFLAIAFHSAAQCSGVENYSLNRPGVVMIKTVFSASVDVRNMRYYNVRFYHLLDSIQQIDTNGIVFSAEQKIGYCAEGNEQ